MPTTIMPEINSSATEVNTVSAPEYYDYSAYYGGDGHSPCEYHDMKSFGQVFLPILYSLVVIVGFIGNGLVVCVLVKHRRQTNLTDICLFHLALSDLIFVFTLPFYSHYAVVDQWTFGDFMCRFISGSHQSSYLGGILFMVVMTMDRYVVIMHAHTAARYRSVRAGVILTVFVWMLSLCISLPSFIFTKVMNDSQELRCEYSPENDHWNNYDLFVKNIVGLVIPFLVMVVCYSMIIPTLVKMRTSKKHRIVKLIICIMIVFFLFWTPYNISLFLQFLQTKYDLLLSCTSDRNVRLSIAVSEAIAYTHCCLNPIIYAFVGQKFMRRALQLLKKWVPGYSRDLSDSSFRRSSVVSKSSDVTATVIL
ncbi:C-C chemokine receptor type 2-like [Pholidichthys leucotaenia]